MGATKKKQIGFYADKDVELYLATIEPGFKGRLINTAVRRHMKELSIDLEGKRSQLLEAAKKSKCYEDDLEIGYKIDILEELIEELENG